MGLSLNNIYKRPYVNPDGRRINKREEENSSTADVRREEQSEQNSKSRGLQYVEQKTQTPIYEAKFNLPPTAYNNVNINKPLDKNTTEINAKSSLEQKRIDSKINIAQILKDFKNTSIAIGTPAEMEEEVNGYIDLINKQVKKDNPNEKLIKSNLKNAASILDNHISSTLKKESKVVENWVDTLFLQNIDFHYNENDINERFLVKFPESSGEQTNQREDITQVSESENNITTEQNSNVIPISVASVNIPQDKKLKSLFIQAKKYAYSKDPENAIKLFERALNRANELDDTETSSKIYYEVGKIYDDHDYVVQALKSYNQSIKLTTDENVKTKAHYSMAQIYDDVNQINPALDHYVSTISHAGEAENLPAQSASLTKIGNIYSDMYEKEAFDYYETAQAIAKETKNYNLRGYVASNTGKAHIKFDNAKSALTSFSSAVKDYTKAQSPVKTAQNYIAAADVMVEYNNPAKALKLLQKAQKYARQTDNINLVKEINTKIRQLKQLAN